MCEMTDETRVSVRQVDRPPSCVHCEDGDAGWRMKGGRVVIATDRCKI